MTEVTVNRTDLAELVGLLDDDQLDACPVDLLNIADPTPDSPATPGAGHPDGHLAALLADSPDQLNALTAEVSAWHARELPGAPQWARVVKVAEEAGELVGALLKVGQQQRCGYRPERDYTREARLEWADVIISELGAAEALGIDDPWGLVLERWADVSARRIATAPAA